jgi:ribose transport system substrate-binding protein
MKAGIPAIELARKAVGTPGKDYTAFVDGDNYKIAFEAGAYTARTLLPDGGEVVVLEGLPSSTPAVASGPWARPSSTRPARLKL